MEPIEPTIVSGPKPGPAADQRESFDVSRGRVGFVVGDRPRFADETAALLRNRLTAATAVIVVVLAAAFIGNLLQGVTELVWLRAIIFLITLGCLVTLRSDLTGSLLRLRTVELIVFGAVVVQMSLMLATLLAEYTSRNDAASLVSVRQMFLAAWCVVIFIYGIFVPNTWKRAAAVTIPMALAPYLVIAFQTWRLPAVGVLLAADQAGTPIPLPLVASCVAVFGAHIIYSVRRAAFKDRQFGQYRLVERLGGGGMGEVFRAEHVLLKRPCAIKLIQAASEADAVAIERFEKEVTATAKLTHWNTVEIYDYGRTADGTFYYVMELLPGMSLDALVERHGPLPPERVVYLLRQVCGALHEAHSAGLIHRDIKPANIFAAQRGGVYDVAKLLDFGLVKQHADERDDRRTRYGSFSGTPLYMSPEQAAAYEHVDARADIYSLGAVAYYLVTGQPPFTGKNILEILAAHRDRNVAPPSRWNTTIAPDVEQIIMTCLAKRPADRYQDAEALRQALDGCTLATAWGPQQAAAWWRSAEQTMQPGRDLGEQPEIVPTVDCSTKDGIP